MEEKELVYIEIVVKVGDNRYLSNYGDQSAGELEINIRVPVEAINAELSRSMAHMAAYQLIAAKAIYESEKSKKQKGERINE